MTNANATKGQPKAEPNYSGASSNGGRNTRTRARGTVSYTDVSAEGLLSAIASITDGGAAIILGKTSDGGAFSVTVLNGAERVREYAHNVAEFEDTLSYLEGMFTSC